jgi:hypothetical protein
MGEGEKGKAPSRIEEALSKTESIRQEPTADQKIIITSNELFSSVFSTPLTSK